MSSFPLSLLISRSESTASSYSWGSIDQVEDNSLLDDLYVSQTNSGIKLSSIVESLKELIALGCIEPCIDLMQEEEEGNIEYKLKLVDKSVDRITHLTTQMNFRLTEGLGEMKYMVGFEDNGFPLGISESDLIGSLRTIEDMAHSLLCDVSILHLRRGKEAGYCCEICVKRITEHSISDVKLCVLGGSQSGKTTLVGVLTRGKLDNGSGSARLEVFRHRHEMENGFTSAIIHEIIGFNSKNETINYSTFRNNGWTDIVRASEKVVTLIDLAGHPRYQNTTIFGITSAQPDYSIIVVDITKGIERISREHLGICLALKIPFSIVVTKTDLVNQDEFKIAMENIEKMLKSTHINCTALYINCEDDVTSAISKIYGSKSFKKTTPPVSNSRKSTPRFPGNNDATILPPTIVLDSLASISSLSSTHNVSGIPRIIPIFQASLVNGSGLALFLQYLRLLPKRRVYSHAVHAQAHFSIDGTYWVSGIGTVCTGLLLKGTLHSGDTLLLGPIAPIGSFIAVTVKSIHYKQVPVSTVEAGQHCSVALNKIKRTLVRKGMILTHPTYEPRPAFGFDCKLRLLNHPNTLNVGYTATIHAGSICQPAQVIALNRPLKSLDRGLVTFRFKNNPEFITYGTKFIFRDSATQSKGLGKIVKIYFSSESINSVTSENNNCNSDPMHSPNSKPLLYSSPSFSIIRREILPAIRKLCNFGLPTKQVLMGENVEDVSVEGRTILVVSDEKPKEDSSKHKNVVSSITNSVVSDEEDDQFDELDSILDKSLGAALDRETNINFESSS